MPERPDLEYQVPILAKALLGRRVHSARLLLPVLLRQAIPGELNTLLAGREVLSVQRRAHVLRLDLGPDLELDIHPMLAGRFTLCPPGARLLKDTGFVLNFGDLDFRYRDDKQMGRVHLLHPQDRDHTQGLGPVGVDVLGPDFTPERLRALAQGRREQVKLFLMDKSALDAFGNAYADEALFAAGIHPKTRVNQLDQAALLRLHAGIIRVLRHANEEIQRRNPPLDGKIRDFLSVRNRKGAPCPQCGSPIRVVGVSGHDAFFCAKCQPDTAGRGLVDWSKLG